MLHTRLRLVRQSACMALMLIAHFHYSYDLNGGWWHSLLGLALIILAGYLTWGRGFFIVVGLRRNVSVLMSTVVFTGLALPVCFAAIWSIASANGVTLRLAWASSYVHDAVYILNEEMVLGGVAIYLLTRRLRMLPLHASFLLALLLAVAHLALYKSYFRDKGFLDFTTVCSLFFAIFLKNNLIIRFRHIGFAWGLHFAWMACMYGTIHLAADGTQLTDLQKFNLYLGSPVVTAVCMLLSILSLFKAPLARGMRRGEELQ